MTPRGAGRDLGNHVYHGKLNTLSGDTNLGSMARHTQLVKVSTALRAAKPTTENAATLGMVRVKSEIRIIRNQKSCCSGRGDR